MSYAESASCGASLDSSQSLADMSPANPPAGFSMDFIPDKHLTVLEGFAFLGVFCFLCII